jgi:hypothetical protein
LWSDPLSLDRFGGKFRTPSKEKKGVIDVRERRNFSAAFTREVVGSCLVEVAV